MYPHWYFKIFYCNIIYTKNIFKDVYKSIDYGKLFKMHKDHTSTPQIPLDKLT